MHRSNVICRPLLKLKVSLARGTIHRLHFADVHKYLTTVATLGAENSRQAAEAQSPLPARSATNPFARPPKKAKKEGEASSQTVSQEASQARNPFSRPAKKRSREDGPDNGTGSGPQHAGHAAPPVNTGNPFARPPKKVKTGSQSGPIAEGDIAAQPLTHAAKGDVASPSSGTHAGPKAGNPFARPPKKVRTEAKSGAAAASDIAAQEMPRPAVGDVVSSAAGTSAAPKPANPFARPPKKVRTEAKSGATAGTDIAAHEVPHPAEGDISNPPSGIHAGPKVGNPFARPPKKVRIEQASGTGGTTVVQDAAGAPSEQHSPSPLRAAPHQLQESAPTSGAVNPFARPPKKLRNASASLPVSEPHDNGNVLAETGSVRHITSIAPQSSLGFRRLADESLQSTFAAPAAMFFPAHLICMM